MSTAEFLLSPHNVRDYLAKRGFVQGKDEVAVTALGGGISNIVLLVEWFGEPSRRWVIKQSLEKLEVEAEWRSERARIYREAQSITSLRPVLGPAALPEVIHVDSDSFLYVMTAAPEGSISWKDSLLARRADAQIARNVGLLLAKMINSSREATALATVFQDRTIFHQLRVDPYYRTTAARHPELRRQFEDLIAATLAIRTSLVHGDFSPKNMLVRGENVFVIDFEVVHWGDPSFDAAFLMNHLFLKAFHQPAASEEYIELALDFWKALLAALEPQAAPGFEVMSFRHLGALLLARIDGKSPVEYIEDEATKNRVRKAGTEILLKTPATLEGVAEIVKKSMAD